MNKGRRQQKKRARMGRGLARVIQRLKEDARGLFVQAIGQRRTLFIEKYQAQQLIISKLEAHAAALREARAA